MPHEPTAIFAIRATLMLVLICAALIFYFFVRVSYSHDAECAKAVETWCLRPANFCY